MKHTSKYIFSFCFLMLFFSIQAQETTSVLPKSEPKKTSSSISNTPKEVNLKNTTVKKDTVVPIKKDRYGLRVGLDLYKLTRGLYDKNYKGIEFVGDYRLSKKHYLSAELGSEDKTNEDDRLNTNTTGTYLKVGFDYNAYENWLDMENIISAGLRTGFSTFSQELNSYRIYNSNPYWDETTWIQSGNKSKILTAGWIEVVAGIKAKVYNNIFVGFSLRMNYLIYDKKPSDQLENLYIPGFNRTYDGKFGAGFNYTITYFIPFYNKVIKPIDKVKSAIKK